MQVRLNSFDNSWYDPGRRFAWRVLWHIINAFIMQNPFNLSSRLKVVALRMFGAKIGKGVVLKPGINVKYPWNLEIGDYTWIGEGAWLDSLAPIVIGNNACISQGAYFCTGNHDWTDPAFGLVIKPIVIKDGVWVGARSMVLPGVTMDSHSILSAGSVMARDSEPYMIYAGNPAVSVKKRTIR